MNFQEKLKIIQKISGLTQTKLADKFGVSFVAFNNWWTGKSKPRTDKENLIDELYKELTGQKVIPASVLQSKKLLLTKESKKYKNILKTIISRPDIYDHFLLSLTYHSNKIEGSTLSENETADIIFRNKALSNKSLIEQLEVKNHQTALQYLFNYLNNNGKIDDKLILKLHAILMNGIREDAGFFRRHSVRIVGSNVPTANYLKLPDLMEKLVRDINKKESDPINLIASIHAQFEAVHPFSDGNGRIGRLIMNAMLIKMNLAPAVINQASKIQYYNCLNKAQLKGDSSQLEDFICEAVLQSFSVINE